MFRVSLIVLIVLVCGQLPAQSDTINQIDSLGRKQGFWRYTVAMEYPANSNPWRDSTSSFGYYADGLKEGLWTYNALNGQLISKYTYVHDTCNGPAYLYGKGGVMTESFERKGLAEVGEHFYYTVDSSGAVHAHRLGGVNGHVTRIRANKIPGACRITLSHTDNFGYYRVDGSVEADSNGYYFFYDLKPGYYKLRCVIEGAEYVDKSVSIEYDDTLTADIEMKPDFSGKPTAVLCGGLNIGDMSTFELRFGIIDFHDWNKFKFITDESTLGCEVNFQFRDFMIGPKINYTRTYGFLFFGIPFGGSLIYYTDFEKGSLYFQPHIGFQELFILDFSAGYNIPLDRNQVYFNARVSQIFVTVTLRLYNMDHL